MTEDFARRVEEEETRTRRVLDATYHKLSDFEKFRLATDLRLMSNVYDMDTHKWFYSLHEDALTTDPRGRVRGAWGDARSLYASVPAYIKLVVVLTLVLVFFVALPAVAAAFQNRKVHPDLATYLKFTGVALTCGGLLKWGTSWFVVKSWA